MTDPKGAGDRGEVKRYCVRCEPGEVQADRLVENEYGPVVPYSALAEAKQEAADNEADYQGLARLIEEAGYPHLRALIQALEDAQESSRRDNQMAAMAEIKIAEARKRAEAAEARVAELEAKVARADRLAEAVAGFDKAAGPFSYLKHTLDAYRSDSPPQAESDFTFEDHMRSAARLLPNAAARALIEEWDAARKAEEK